MADEFDAYRETVLDAARAAGNTPPPDLFVRYDLDPRSAGDPAEFSRRVEAVVKYWRKLKLQKKYGALATALLAADTDLRRKGLLSLEAFTKRREESRGDAHTRLNEEVAVIAAARPCVTLTGLRRLVASMDNMFSEQEIREALGQQGVRVIDPPWDVPAGSPIPAVRSLRAPLTALGFKLSPEALFGTEAVRAGFTLRQGFRLADGRTITTAALEKVRSEQARAKQDERKTAMDNVIAILINAAQANNLDALLLGEVREQLRPAIEAGEAERLVSLQATRLGLEAGEAIELAVTLAGQSGEVKRGDDTAQRVAEALREGELREAQRLLDTVPSGECTEQRAQLDETLRRVADLVARAETALREGEGEQAAGLFAEATELARDDEGLGTRLADIPPPPPAEVTAGVDGDRVVVRWTPSRARTPGVRYRVVRSAGTPAVSSAAGTTVAETQANEAEDELPPCATPLHYTVFCSRGETWSVGVSASALELVPPVRDVVLSAGEGVVNGSWHAHQDTTEVVVTRADRSGSTERRIRVSSATFTDSDVTNGETYDYALRAVYLSQTGERRTSPAVVASARPDAKPVAVTDLVHEVRQEDGGAVLVVSWRPPAAGVVELRLSQGAPPPWPVGSLVSRAEAQAFGQPAGGMPAMAENARVRQVLPVRAGRLTVTAITVSGDHAAIGKTVSQSLVAAVTGVRADRYDDMIRVRWAWPEGATAVRVRWWPTGEDDTPLHVEEIEISARVHTDSGGAELVVGPGATTVSLQTVLRDQDSDSVSAAVLTRIPGRPALVGYQVRVTGLPGRRRLDLTLTSDRGCRVPAIIVVHRADGVIPLRADRGRVIASLPSRNLTAGVPVTVPLPERVSPLSGLACFPDPASTTADEVTLVPRTAR